MNKSKKRWKLLIVIAVSGLAMTLPAKAALAGPGAVTGSKHDLGSPGSPSCVKCHIAHGGRGEYLWARTPNTAGGSGEAPLCYSCHDGTVTSAGRYAFDTAYRQHDEGDCKTCHNAHSNQYGRFLDFSAGANFCNSCHSSGEHDHPVNVQPGAGDTPVDQIFNPNTNDFSGTRLYNQAGTALATTGGYVKCLTCHSPHGGNGENITTMPHANSGNSTSPLCQNCHGG
ncbi:MAG: cytochrome c3 family protein [Candidatus Aquicultorales bacterium]